jgi:hypothetical protein
MKAGSLRDDQLGALRESVSSPSSGEVCLEVCSTQCFSLPSSVFVAQRDRRFEIYMGRPDQGFKNSRKGSLTGKAVVLKTTARCRLRVRVLSLPPTWICSSAEVERDSAKVEGARSNRARSTKFLTEWPSWKARVSETLLCRFESCLRSQTPRTRSSVGMRTVVFETTSRRFESCRVHHAGVAQLG